MNNIKTFIWVLLNLIFLIVFYCISILNNNNEILGGTGTVLDNKRSSATPIVLDKIFSTKYVDKQLSNFNPFDNIKDDTCVHFIDTQNYKSHAIYLADLLNRIEDDDEKKKKLFAFVEIEALHSIKEELLQIKCEDFNTESDILSHFCELLVSANDEMRKVVPKQGNGLPNKVRGEFKDKIFEKYKGYIKGDSFKISVIKKIYIKNGDKVINITKTDVDTDDIDLDNLKLNDLNTDLEYESINFSEYIIKIQEKIIKIQNKPMTIPVEESKKKKPKSNKVPSNICSKIINNYEYLYNIYNSMNSIIYLIKSNGEYEKKFNHFYFVFKPDDLGEVVDGVNGTMPELHNIIFCLINLLLIKNIDAKDSIGFEYIYTDKDLNKSNSIYSNGKKVILGNQIPDSSVSADTEVKLKSVDDYVLLYRLKQIMARKLLVVSLFTGDTQMINDLNKIKEMYTQSDKDFYVNIGKTKNMYFKNIKVVINYMNIAVNEVVQINDSLDNILPEIIKDVDTKDVDPKIIESKIAEYRWIVGKIQKTDYLKVDDVYNAYKNA